MTQRLEDQFKFAECIGLLIAEVQRRGWRCTGGDWWAVDFNWMIEKLDPVFCDRMEDNESVDFISHELKKRKHSHHSKHYDRLAWDMNLFKPALSGGGMSDLPLTTVWEHCTKTEDYAELGAFWKSLDPGCTWGGDFSNPDGNHFSYKEGI